MHSTSQLSHHHQTTITQHCVHHTMGDSAPSITIAHQQQQQQQQQLLHPLIDRDNYRPDTLDFRTDAAAQEYWTHCFESLAAKFAEQAARSQQQDPTAAERSAGCLRDFLNQMRALETKNKSSEDRLMPFSIRTLLDLCQHCLVEYGFDDPWREVKQVENAAALEQLRQRLDDVDQLEDSTEKWTELLRGVFAGNVFDSGAQAVSEIRAKDSSFGLSAALSKIQKRPWLVDNLNSFLNRLQGAPHKCALIFVDNSGVDIVLGVLPFARQLLQRGTKVILCANRSPALNDITCGELRVLLDKCRTVCPLLGAALDERRLLVADNGQSGPCLDMRYLSEELNSAIHQHDVDLLVIEGMGRALHTNFDAKFRCETLKLAVVKNAWFAQRLGGDNFSVICKFEEQTSSEVIS